MVVLNEKCIWGGQLLTGFPLSIFWHFSKNLGSIVFHFAGDNLSGPGGTRDGGVK